MRIQCSNPMCQAQFEVKDALFSLGKPRKVRCAYCRISFHVTRLSPVVGEEEEVTFENTMLLNLWNRPKEKEIMTYQQYAVLVREGRISGKGNEPPSLEGSKAEATLMMEGEEADADAVPLFQQLSLTCDEKAAHLTRSGWWSQGDQGELNHFAEYWEAFAVRKSATLFRPGDQNSFLCIIVSGQVDLMAKGEGGKKQRLLATLNAGDSLGERTLFGAYSRVSQAVVREESLFLLLFEEKLRRMGKRHPGLWRDLLLKVATMMLPLVAHRVAAQEDCFAKPLRGDPPF